VLNEMGHESQDNGAVGGYPLGRHAKLYNKPPTEMCPPTTRRRR
jgi:hypothetical protein